MSGDDRYSTVLAELRRALAGMKPGQRTFDEIVSARDQVLARYKPIFCVDHLPSLTKEEFASFLYLENNHHWSGLYRKGLGAATDMGKLRDALRTLLDESQSIRERFAKAVGKVAGLGKAIATAILTVAYPEKYGVWNNTSESALRKFGLWPATERGEGVGGQYEKMNDVLRRIVSDLGTDFWTLDAIWWYLLDPTDMPPLAPDSGGGIVRSGESFALERQLEEFLLENWERTPLAKEWIIFSTTDDPEAGHQFPTDVGPIDILAKHRSESRFLVIELKRNQTTDQTIGQALRYVGWVRQHLAKNGETVEALIIGHTAEKGALYALTTVPHVRMMTYEVEFRLKPVG